MNTRAHQQPIVGDPDDVGKSLSPPIHLPFMEGGLPLMVIPSSVKGWNPESTGLIRYSEIASYTFMSDVPAIIIYMISKSGRDLGASFFATRGEFRIL